MKCYGEESTFRFLTGLPPNIIATNWISYGLQKAQREQALIQHWWYCLKFPEPTGFWMGETPSRYLHFKQYSQNTKTGWMESPFPISSNFHHVLKRAKYVQDLVSFSETILKLSYPAWSLLDFSGCGIQHLIKEISNQI